MAREKDPELRAVLLGQTAAAIHVCKGGLLNGAKPESWWIPRSQIGYMRIDRATPDKPDVPDSVVFTLPEWMIEKKQCWELVP
jgi:hypothetical protein